MLQKYKKLYTINETLCYNNIMIYNKIYGLKTKLNAGVLIINFGDW